MSSQILATKTVPVFVAKGICGVGEDFWKYRSRRVKQKVISQFNALKSIPETWVSMANTIDDELMFAIIKGENICGYLDDEEYEYAYKEQMHALCRDGHYWVKVGKSIINDCKNRFNYKLILNYYLNPDMSEEDIAKYENADLTVSGLFVSLFGFGGRIAGKIKGVPKTAIGDDIVDTSKVNNNANEPKFLIQGKIGNFIDIDNIRDFMSRIPSNAKRLPWKKIPGGAEQGIKYEWTDSSGNKWQARAHEADPSAPTGSNASEGWVYRVQVKYGGKGKWYYMDTQGNFHVENIFNKNSPSYNEEIANDTHIKFVKDR